MTTVEWLPGNGRHNPCGNPLIEAKADHVCDESEDHDECFWVGWDSETDPAAAVFPWQGAA